MTTVQGKLAINGGTPVRRRPFPAWPRHDDAERQSMLRALESGTWGGRATRGQGEAAAFESEFAQFCEAPAALAVTNGTQALQLALKLSGVEPGDHVLVPALSPVPVSNAVRQCGALPVPADVDPLTYCLTPDRLASARTDRTTAVLAVHLGGHVADMDSIVRWAGHTGTAVIQDAAHAHGARWHDRGLGALGTVATFSFMQTKVMTAGEGGALLLPSTDRYEEAFSRHCLGREPGSVPSFRTASSNYRINEFAAAVLRAQLGRLPGQNERREQRWRELTGLVEHIPGLTPQGRDPRCTLHSHYLAPLRLDLPRRGAASRDFAVRALRAEGIPVFALFPPVYRVPAFWDGRAQEAAAGMRRLAAACPNSERLGAWGLSLRHEVLLGGRHDVHEVAEALAKVLAAIT